MKKKWQIAIGTTVGAAVLLTSGYLIWCNSLEDTVIWEKVSINGVALQGKTIEDAQKAIQEKFEKDYKNAAIKVKLDDKTYETKIFPVLTLDADKEIQQAYKFGHGEWYKRGIEYWKLQKMESQKLEILPEPMKPSRIKRVIRDTGIEKVNTLEETSCELTEDALIIKKGKTGIKADTVALFNKIYETLKNHEYNGEIVCPSVEVVPEDVDLQPYYDQIYVKKCDAYLDPKQNYEVVPSVEGVSFDKKEAEKKVKDAPEGTEIKINFVIEKPEITTEEMESRLFRDVLGSYTTYGGGTAARVNNMTLASNSCNDVILLPGEVFSYNDTVGERSTARGYQAATVFVNGQAVPGVGGGICQVSSTLFMASLYADMEIEERYNHSLTVGYMPMGMDATVAWGLLDYKFKNNTEYPVKIKLSYAGGAVQAQIIGTKEDNNRVEITTKSLGPKAVDTYRTIYDENGAVLKSEKVCTSRYK